jgi:hypothetical protein
MLASIATFAPVLLCVGGMTVCMLAMGRMGRRSHDGSADATTGHADTDAEVAELRAEVDRLRAEVRQRSDADTAS